VGSSKSMGKSNQLFYLTNKNKSLLIYQVQDKNSDRNGAGALAQPKGLRPWQCQRRRGREAQGNMG
jgi:hypothetical protein